MIDWHDFASSKCYLFFVLESMCVCVDTGQTTEQSNMYVSLSAACCPSSECTNAMQASVHANVNVNVCGDCIDMNFSFHSLRSLYA